MGPPPRRPRAACTVVGAASTPGRGRRYPSGRGRAAAVRQRRLAEPTLSLERQPRMTRIGVLTGGGDVPGLNACIKTLVYGAVDRGYEVVGLRRGWAGLLDYDLDADVPQPRCAQPLGKNDVRTIDRTGGTFLHTSRTNPAKVKPRDVPAFLAGEGQAESEGPFDFTAHCLEVIDRLGL